MSNRTKQEQSTVKRLIGLKTFTECDFAELEWIRDRAFARVSRKNPKLVEAYVNWVESDAYLAYVEREHGRACRDSIVADEKRSEEKSKAWHAQQERLTA
jgi:hypothetical protein